MKENNFPDAIKENEVRGEEMYFFSQQSGKVNKMTVMKATKNCITALNDFSEIAVRELPVYIKLLTTYIYSGKTASLN